ncbi:MAG: hypothetical protein H6581_09790 [Bacteroidia bacterium]|nr:hypothetical protein [Bacteroidia bacterium]
MRKPAIYIADLRHNYQGVISTDAMPLAAGYLKAVLDRDLSEVESEAFAYPGDLLEAMQNRPPAALLLTNYMWNEALNLHFAAHAKALNPGCLTILGGPNLPIEDDRKIKYLRSKPYLDIYCTGEGDFWVAQVLGKFLEHNLSIPALLKEEIHSALYRRDGEIVVTPIQPRTRNLDEIPSPWLSGVMDKFFDGRLAPLWETNRGCPFTCTFCVQGTGWYTKVNYFSMERIQAEVDHIGQLIARHSPNQKMLRIADPNYGMFKRDIEISAWLGEAQQKYNWPLLIDATTGKNQAENIIQSIEKVNGALAMYQAVQSLDTSVLENIKRKNIKLETYEDIQIHIRGRGLRSSSDLILGLPGESLQSHLHSLEKLINSGTHKLNNFQAMLLLGSELEMLEARQRYGFQTRFRMLPKNFGEYGGQRVVGIEEIIVSTDTLSFADYLQARVHHLAISVFWNESRFQELVEFCESFGLTRWDWLREVVVQMQHFPAMQELLQGFLAETKGELFATEAEAREFYLQEENWQKLESNQIGDNLIYKYRALGSFWYWEAVVKCAFAAAQNLLTHAGREFPLQFWQELEEFFYLRHAHGRTREDLLAPARAHFTYDLGSWLQAGMPADPELFRFASPQALDFALSPEHQTNIRAALETWGYDPATFSMLVKRMRESWQVREVKKIAKKGRVGLSL